MKPSGKPTLITLLLAAFSVLPFNSCFIYSTQEEALVRNIDVDETLKVAHDEMKKTSEGQSLGIWVLRDQVVTPAQAKVISDLYLANIEKMSPFNIWHASWTISNLYRLGNQDVKAVLEQAYKVAKKQPERLDGMVRNFAQGHINGEELTTGFIHLGGYYYALKHVVAPGNKKYLQSYEQYRKSERESEKRVEDESEK